MEKHKDAYTIIDFLFPMDRTGNVPTFQTPPKPNHILVAELRINHINHFEKYFSFHVRGKISELSFSNFKAKINSGENGEALEVINEMIQSSGERKIVYRISSEIKVISDELQDKFILFLIKNINEFSEVSDVNPHHFELVETIAKKLVLKRDEKKGLIISVAKSLDHIQLCLYLEVFLYDGKDVKYINELEEILVSKVKIIEKHPFFKDRNIAKTIMYIWSRVNPPEFHIYMFQYLDSEANISFFVKSFPYVWNRTINGIFKEEDFKYVTEVLELDSKRIFNKIQKFVPELKDLSAAKETKANWSEQSDNSAINNIRQFSYWHLLKENQDEIDRTT